MLSDTIQTLRCEKGWSQEELATRLSVVRQTISKWEKGLSVPDSDMLVRLAEAFGTTVAQLVGEEDGSPANSHSKKGNATTIAVVLGFPVWFPLLVAAVVVVLALYISMWAVIVSLWAAFAALVGGAIGGIAMVFCGSFASRLAMGGLALVCAGLSIAVFFGCKAVTIGAVALTKKAAVRLGNAVAKREVAP